MGYYVTLEQSTAVLPAEHLDKAYEILVALNDPSNNAAKQGGAWKAGVRTGWWYSWMDENYPEKCANAKEVFEALGFEMEETPEGDLRFVWYDSKTGQEDLFLASVAPLMTGHMHWRGEDGALYGFQFGPEGMTELEATVHWGPR